MHESTHLLHFSPTFLHFSSTFHALSCTFMHFSTSSSDHQRLVILSSQSKATRPNIESHWCVALCPSCWPLKLGRIFVDPRLLRKRRSPPSPTLRQQCLPMISAFAPLSGAKPQQELPPPTVRTEVASSSFCCSGGRIWQQKVRR